MTVLDTTTDTDRYAQQVRDACSDLPPSTRDELLEDLDEHLADVVADLGEDESLADRLGSAEAYAADLRQSAGYPAPATTGEPGRGRILHNRIRHGRIATWVRSLWDQSETHPQGQVVRSYLTDLRPAWWLARAYLVATGLADITSDDARNVIPHLFDSSAIGLVAVIALGWWSIRLGRSTQPTQEPTRRLRRRALAFNLIAAFCLLVVMSKLDDIQTVYEPVDYGQPSAEPGVLTAADGSQIENIYAFSSDGKPLDGVLLYDQQGRPLDNAEIWDAEGNHLVPQFPTTRDGTHIRNSYPTRFWVTDEVGRSVKAPGRPNLAVPVVVDPPKAATTTTAPARTTTTTPPKATTTSTPATATTAVPVTTTAADPGN